MKTRSNMPLFVVETTNITALSNSQIDLLRCGDYLVKKTGNMQHAYKVTYKEDKHGICLSYFACGYSETVSYDYVDGNWVYNSTDISLTNRMEEIVDADGHNRFVEGDITCDYTGFTQTYAKWSLSGTHLMIVVAGSLAQANIDFGTFVDEIVMPDWIKDKIIPVSTDTIRQEGVIAYGGTSQTIYFQLRKSAQNKLFITISAINLNADKSFAVQFDLLIDNE